MALLKGNLPKSKFSLFKGASEKSENIWGNSPHNSEQESVGPQKFIKHFLR